MARSSYKLRAAQRFVADIDAVVAQALARTDATPCSVEAVAATWRFAGIQDPDEVSAWIDSGVFDGHRAGLLRLAGIRSQDMAALPAEARRKTGVAFSMGELSVAEVRNLIDVYSMAGSAVDGSSSMVVSTDAGDSTGSPDEG